MKKIFLSLVVLVTSAFVFVSCSKQHEHQYGNQWLNDGTHHWHECTGEDCSEIHDKAEHTGGTATETKKAVCEVCGAAYGSFYVHEHSYVIEKVATEYLVSEATCNSEAIYYKSCSCGEKGTETFTDGEALGHTWGEWETKTSADCENAEVEHRVCTTPNCGHEETRTGDAALGHKMTTKFDGTHHWTSCDNEGCLEATEKVAHFGGEATETEKAVCTGCGQSYGEFVAHGHIAGEWETKTPATCTEAEVEHRVCSICGKNEETRTGDVEALGHDFTKELAEEAYCKVEVGCETDGEYYKSCSRCGVSSQGTEDEATFIVDALGHEGTVVAELKATSATKGIKHIKCDSCGEIIVTETDFDDNNSAVLTPSPEDKEINNVDIVRGLYGNAKIEFTFHNQMIDNIENWNVGRVIFMVENEGKYSGNEGDCYTRTIPFPEPIGVQNGANKIYKKNDGFNSLYSTWFDGTYTDHAKNMDVDVTIIRMDDIVTVKMVGNCKEHENCHNENNVMFYLSKDKALNVVLGTTFGYVTVLETSLEIVASSTEKLQAPIVKEVTSTDANSTTESQVYTYTFDSELKTEKVVFTFEEKSSVNRNDNQNGHWLGYLWTSKEGLKPWDDVTNGTILTKFTPVQDHFTDWNGMTRVWCLEGGEHGDYSKDMYLWPMKDGQVFNDISFADLMDDCTVTIEIVKIDRAFYMTVTYNSNVHEGVYASRYYCGILPNGEILFTLGQKDSNITLKSVVVESLN